MIIADNNPHKDRIKTLDDLNAIYVRQIDENNSIFLWPKVIRNLRKINAMEREMDE